MWRLVIENGPFEVLDTMWDETLEFEENVYDWVDAGKVHRAIVLASTLLVAAFIGEHAAADTRTRDGS